MTEIAILIHEVNICWIYFLTHYLVPIHDIVIIPLLRSLKNLYR